jgi:hypothetical protein
MSRQPTDRLRQYVLLLSSDQPGEVVAAAGMLIKHLKTQGKDIHDLAALVTGATPTAPPPNNAELNRLKTMFAEERRVRLSAEDKVKKLQQDVQTLQIQLLAANLNKQHQQQSTGRTSAHMPGDNAYAEPPEGEWVFKPLHRTWWEKACWCLNYADRSQEQLLSTADYNFLVKMSALKPKERIGYMGERQIDDIYARLQRVKAAAQ